MSRQSPSLASTLLRSILTSGSTVALSAFTGILVARLLGPEGRGQVAAISTWLFTLSWASMLGFFDAMVYQRSKDAATDGEVVATVLVSVPILGVLGVVIAQFLVPLGFSAQSDETRLMARLFLCGIPWVVGVYAVWCLLMSQHRFRFLDWVRFASAGRVCSGTFSACRLRSPDGCDHAYGSNW